MPLIWLLPIVAIGVVLGVLGFSFLSVFVLGGAVFAVIILGISFLYRNEIPVDGGEEGEAVPPFLEDIAKRIETGGAEAAMVEIEHMTENAAFVLELAETIAGRHRLYFCALPRGLRDGELWVTRNESLRDALESEAHRSNLYLGSRDPKHSSLVAANARTTAPRLGHSSQIGTTPSY